MLENSTFVVTLSATDPDDPPDTVTFSIVGGADAFEKAIQEKTNETEKK